MKFPSFLLFVPLVCASPQTPAPKPQSTPQTKTITLPGGKPGQPQPTVTLSAENVTPPPTDPNKVILTIGSEKITAAQFDQIVNALPEQYRGAARGAGRRQFAENLVRIHLLSSEARKHSIDKSPEFQNQLAFQTDNMLAGLYFQDLMKNVKVDDADLKKYYDEHKSEWEQVRARHILIRTKGSAVPLKQGQKELTDEEALAKAQEIRKKLAAGGDFAELAKTESADAGSGANGGDLGFFKHGQMVPQFEQAAFALKAGEISEPVKSPFGYHIIKVDEKQAKPIEELKPELEKRMRPEAAQKQLEQMRNSAKIDMDTEFFGAPELKQAAPPAAPATK